MPSAIRSSSSHRVARLDHQLASDESAFVTGSELVMDGGVTARPPSRMRGGGRWT